MITWAKPAKHRILVDVLVNTTDSVAHMWDPYRRRWRLVRVAVDIAPWFTDGPWDGRSNFERIGTASGGGIGRHDDPRN